MRNLIPVVFLTLQQRGHQTGYSLRDTLSFIRRVVRSASVLAVTLTCISPRIAQAQAVEDVDICFGPHMLSLPGNDFLRLSLIEDNEYFPGKPKLRSDYYPDIAAEFGEDTPPPRALSIQYTWMASRRNRDALQGPHSPRRMFANAYKINFHGRPNSHVETFAARWGVGEIVKRGGSTEIVPLDLTIFDRSLLFSCGLSLPAFSKDPNRSACSASARLDETTLLNFSFVAANDVDDSWPPRDGSLQSFSMWQPRMDALENAIETKLTRNAPECS